MRQPKRYVVAAFNHNGTVWQASVIGKVAALECVRNELRNHGVCNVSISEVRI